MAIEATRYLSYSEAAFIHIKLMRLMGETRYGVFDRALVESALARPLWAAEYEKADIIRQAATLVYGLVKNHPWTGGNKRTATMLMRIFLRLNGYQLTAITKEEVEMILAVESDRWRVDEIELWLRQRVVTRQRNV